MATENLMAEKGIEKIKSLAEEADICLFCTNLSQRPINGRPMSTQEVDEEGNLWFLSGESSQKNMDILNDKNVQLFYSNKGHAEFLSVYGTAEIIKDREKAKELWKPLIKAWFTEGVDDPELTIIKVVPQEAYYWDTKHNRMVSLMKIVAGAISGKTMDDSIEGEIRI